MRPLLIAAALAAALGSSTANAGDPYGPRVRTSVAPPPAPVRSSQFLGMKDGGPRYAVPPNAKGAAAQSGLFAVDLDMLYPVGSRNQSPKLESGGYFTADYIVDFWRRYPNARSPSDDPGARAPGALQPRPIFLTGDAKERARIPAKDQARLSAQAERALDLLLANPWLGAPLGHEVRYAKRYLINQDANGNEVYGFELYVQIWPIDFKDGAFQKNGRWHHPPGGEAPALTVRSNAFGRLRPPVGRRGDIQVVDDRKAEGLIQGVAAVPLFVPEYKTGEGPLIANPDLFAGVKDKSAIQFLSVWTGLTSPSASELAQGRLHPMTDTGKLTAGTFLTPWSRLVAEDRSGALQAK